MGKTDRPVLNDNYDLGNIDTLSGVQGQQTLDDILAEMKTGTPSALRSSIEQKGLNTISGNRKTGEERLRRTFAQNGDVPIGAKTDAMAGLDVNAGKNLNDLYLNLDEMDYKAKQNAFQKYLQLNGLALAKAGVTNDARGRSNRDKLTSYGIESQGDFSIGDAVGGLLGAGGNVIGGLAGGGYL